MTGARRFQNVKHLLEPPRRGGSTKKFRALCALRAEDKISVGSVISMVKQGITPG
jgi:hypothetical protein